SRPHRRHRPGDAGRIDLRPGTDGVRSHPVRPQKPGPRAAGGAFVRPAAPATAAERERMATRGVEISSDGAKARVPEGWTILEACRAQGIETPTLCYLETLTPVNVCRLCVVEVTGSRALVPACSRKVEHGMVVSTNSDRVRLSRKMVLEFLASSVDLSLA